MRSDCSLSNLDDEGNERARPLLQEGSLTNGGPPQHGEPQTELELALAVETVLVTEVYMRFCGAIGITPHAGVLTFLRLRLPCLRPQRQCAALKDSFGDRDMYAFCDFMLRSPEQSQAVFEHWSGVDLDWCAISADGCLMLSRVLRLRNCRVGAVCLHQQRVGADGSAALAQAIRENRAIYRVSLKFAGIEDQGANEFVDLLSDGSFGLAELDLSCNRLSYQACTRLQLAAPKDFELVLKGNRVYDEVLNASSHGLGVLATVVGIIFMAVETADENDDFEKRRISEQVYNGVVVHRSVYTMSVTIYLVSLFLLYLASTLYHSMFALGDHVVRVFTVIDHCAIYLLIAGTYTPFLCILFPDKKLYSSGLLAFLWAMAGLGIMLALGYQGPLKVGLHIVSYVCMGWACLVCAGEIYTRMSPEPMGLLYLLGGGLLYTFGVPFNVRDKQTCGLPDHTIWHIFVMGGSILHYFCIYGYLLDFPYPDPSTA